MTGRVWVELWIPDSTRYPQKGNATMQQWMDFLTFESGKQNTTYQAFCSSTWEVDVQPGKLMEHGEIFALESDHAFEPNLSGP